MRSSTKIKLEALLESKGGQCLDEHWKAVSKKMTFRCSKGHTWTARSASLLYSGSWCRECESEHRRLGLKELTDIASNHNGICLAESYENCNKSVEWKCSEGHVFTRSAKRVKRGEWCAKCKRTGGTGYFIKMADVLDYVESKGAQLVGNARHKEEITEWRCNKGHTFTASGRSIVSRDHFCPSCDGVSSISNIGILSGIAERHMGKLLTTENRFSDSVHGWECAKGHKFTATLRSASRDWCPNCDDIVSDDEQSLHERIAERQNGRCLSEKKNRWLCKSGHVWTGSVESASLHWCPVCTFNQSCEVPLELDLTSNISKN